MNRVDMLSKPRLTALAATGLIFCLGSFTPQLAKAQETAWPAFGHDAQHTGRGSGPRLFPGRMKWKRSVGSPIPAGAALDSDGRVVFGTATGQFFALDREGGLLWKVDLGSPIYTTPARTPSGSWVVGLGNGSLAEISQKGSVVRTVPVGSAIGNSSPTVAPDGTVYIGTVEGDLAAVDAAGVLWKVRLGGGVFSSPAVAPDGTIYVGAADSRFYSLSPAGAVIWSMLAGGVIGTSSPVVTQNGLIVFGARDGRVYGVTSAGATKWATLVTPAGISGSPAQGPDGSVFVGSPDGFLACLSSAGTLRWKAAVGGGVKGAVAVSADGTTYAGTGNGSITAVGPSGAVLWSLGVGDDISGHPALDTDGTLFAGTTGGEMVAVTADPEWFVPAAARAAGQNGTVWRTDLAIFNGSGREASLTFTFLPKDGDNGGLTGLPLSLSAGKVLAIDDVVLALFGLGDGSGAIRIQSSEPEMVVTSRTYNDAPAGTFGQSIPGFPVGSALVAGREGQIVGVIEGTNFRTNLGFVNASPDLVQLKTSFYDSEGVLLGIKLYSLKPFSQIQIGRAFKTVSSADVSGGRMTVAVTSGGSIFAYASMVDNRSGDPVYLPAIVAGK